MTPGLWWGSAVPWLAICHMMDCEGCQEGGKDACSKHLAAIFGFEEFDPGFDYDELDEKPPADSSRQSKAELMYECADGQASKKSEGLQHRGKNRT